MSEWQTFETVTNTDSLLKRIAEAKDQVFDLYVGMSARGTPVEVGPEWFANLMDVLTLAETEIGDLSVAAKSAKRRVETRPMKD